MRYSAFTLWLKYFNHEISPQDWLKFFALVVMTAFSCYINGISIVDYLEFQTDGEAVRARVLSKVVVSLPTAKPLMAKMPLFAFSDADQPARMIRYEFIDAEGKTRQASRYLPFARWQALKPGDPIAVRYLRSDPARNKLEAELRFTDYLWVLTYAVSPPIMLFFSCQGIIGGMRRVNRVVRLVLHGIAIPGRVLSVEVEQHPTRQKLCRTVLKYQYSAAGPRERQLVLEGNQELPWQKDGDIVVLTDPMNPAQVTVDIFDARPADREGLFGPSITLPPWRKA